MAQASLSTAQRAILGHVFGIIFRSTVLPCRVEEDADKDKKEETNST